MKQPLLAVACALMALGLGAQRTIHVSPEGSGNGSSWQLATNLHAALAEASLDDVLWLRSGTYLTSASDDRNEAFEVPPGIQILGGFSGSEQAASRRDPVRQPTILTGEIGTPDAHDNAYTILLLRGDHSATTIDGITIQRAYANGAGGPGEATRAGGGVLVHADRPGTSSTPSFVNCTFAENYARDGGAVYIDGRAALASPSFIACTFRQNEADLDGGAVYNDARRHGLVAPSFTDCQFTGNTANYGGAVFNQATKGEVQARFVDCTFGGNHAYVRGVSLYSIDHQGKSEATLLHCAFDDVETGTAQSSTLARQD